MVDHRLSLVRGDDFELQVRWKDADGVQVPISQARLQIRQRVDTDPVLTLTVGSGLAVASGTVTITLTAAQTAALGDGVWDLEATSTAGKVKTLIGGKVRVTKDVTRG